MANIAAEIFRSSIGHLNRASRHWLQPPWPDLVIGIGQRTVPVARWIRQHSGAARPHSSGSAIRAPPNRLFDLVITTPPISGSAGDNVITATAGDEPLPRPSEPTAEEARLARRTGRARICCCRSAERRQCGSSTLPL